MLGLGWSAGVIGGSTLLAASVSDRNRVSLHGGADALVNWQQPDPRPSPV
jgi:hypothetical protein